jgi:hypothetical protein
VTIGGVVITTVLWPSLANALQKRAVPNSTEARSSEQRHEVGSSYSGEISFPAKPSPALFYF